MNQLKNTLLNGRNFFVTVALLLALVFGLALVLQNVINSGRESRNEAFASQNSPIGINTGWYDDYHIGDKNITTLTPAIFKPGFIESSKAYRAIRMLGFEYVNDTEIQNLTWANRNKITDKEWYRWGKPVPIEVQVYACNLASVDCWFHIPTVATDDYVQNMTKYVRDNLNTYLVPRFEYSNEVWNFGFKQFKYAESKAKELGWGSGGDQWMHWYGKRSAEICDIVKKQTYAGSSIKPRCVMNLQVAWKGLEVAALDCSLWKEGAPCYKHGFDDYGIAPYFGFSETGGKKTSRDFYKNSALDKSAILQSFKENIDTSFGELIPYHVQQAKKYGMTVVGYEGGLDLGWNGSDTSETEKLENKLDREISLWPEMKNSYIYYMTKWRDTVGPNNLFMLHVNVDANQRGGVYGHQENFQSTTPRYDFVKEWNSGAAVSANVQSNNNLDNSQRKNLAASQSSSTSSLVTSASSSKSVSISINSQDQIKGISQQETKVTYTCYFTEDSKDLEKPSPDCKPRNGVYASRVVRKAE
jgi:hypothetical protein